MISKAIGETCYYIKEIWDNVVYFPKVEIVYIYNMRINNNNIDIIKKRVLVKVRNKYYLSLTTIINLSNKTIYLKIWRFLLFHSNQFLLY